MKQSSDKMRLFHRQQLAEVPPGRICGENHVKERVLHALHVKVSASFDFTASL